MNSITSKTVASTGYAFTATYMHIKTIDIYLKFDVSAFSFISDTG